MKEIPPKSEKFKMKFTDIPLGVWDLDGNWFPNLNLKMSASEQLRHNIRGGHFEKQLVADDFRCTLVVSKQESTLMDKIMIWVRGIKHD